MKLSGFSMRLVLGAGLVLAACGDDGPGRLSTGVDTNKPIGTVTPQEADQICKSTQTWAKQAIAEAKQRELTCRVTALALAAGGAFAGGGMGANEAQLRMTCQTSFDQCMMAPVPTSSTVPAMCQSFPATCTATVAEYEACLNDMPPFVDKTLETLPKCETLTQLGLLSLLGLQSTLPATCQTFQTKCGGAGIPGIPTPTPTPMPGS